MSTPKVMQKNSKIFVAGHRGLAGSAICRVLESKGFTNILKRTRTELNLLNQDAVQNFFKSERPEFVFVAAAKVGGIHYNATYPADFLLENLTIQNNVMKSAFDSGVDKLLFLGSSCIYPKHAPQPMAESSLLTGPLEPTNEAYAIAKIAGLKLCEYFKRQYNRRFISAMPCNLYGINDNFHPENSHVLPALMRRFHEAKLQNLKEVVVWGSGTPLREFMYADDMAEALFVLMQTYEEPGTINIGTGEDLSVKAFSELVKEVVGYQGQLRFDTSRPDGHPRKVMDVQRIRATGWAPRTSLREGLTKMYRWALESKTLPS